jgi:NAD-dependent DNA ligase (contains BRCT domain type II)
VELDGFAEISANAAIESIRRSKRVPFSRVLLGLNIPGIGWVLARNLASHFDNVDRLIAATPRRSPRSRASVRTAPRTWSNGSRTSRTAHSSRSSVT